MTLNPLALPCSTRIPLVQDGKCKDNGHSHTQDVQDVHIMQKFGMLKFGWIGALWLRDESVTKLWNFVASNSTRGVRSEWPWKRACFYHKPSSHDASVVNNTKHEFMHTAQGCWWGQALHGGTESLVPEWSIQRRMEEGKKRKEKTETSRCCSTVVVVARNLWIRWKTLKFLGWFEMLHGGEVSSRSQQLWKLLAVAGNLNLDQSHPGDPFLQTRGAHGVPMSVPFVHISHQ